MKTLAITVLLAVVALVALTACPPSPPPVPPTPDASDASSLAETSPAPPAPDAGPPSACAQACSALAIASCPIGIAPNCAAFMQQLSNSGQIANPANVSGLYDAGKPLTCADVVTGVHTAADAQRMGFACGPVSAPAPSVTASVITTCQTSLCGGADTGEGSCSCYSVAGNRRCWRSDADCAFDRACCSKAGATCTGSTDACAGATLFHQGLVAPKATKR